MSEFSDNLISYNFVNVISNRSYLLNSFLYFYSRVLLLFNYYNKITILYKTRTIYCYFYD